jgi:hypothetical protein
VSPITCDFGLGDHPALLTDRVSAVPGTVALLNSVTSKGRSTAPPRYKAAVVATAWCDHGDEDPARRSRRLLRRRKQP